MKKKVVLGLLSACFFATLFACGCREGELYRPGKVSMEITEQKDVTFKSPKNEGTLDLPNGRILKNDSPGESLPEETSSERAGFKDNDSREFTSEDSTKEPETEKSESVETESEEVNPEDPSIEKKHSGEERNSSEVEDEETEDEEIEDEEIEDEEIKDDETRDDETRDDETKDDKTRDDKTKNKETRNDETKGDETVDEIDEELDEEITTEIDEDIPLETDEDIRDKNRQKAVKEKAVTMTMYGAFLFGDDMTDILEKADEKASVVVDPDTGKSAFLSGSQEVTVIGETDNGWYHIKKYTALGPMSKARIDGYVPKSALITAEEREQIINERGNR